MRDPARIDRILALLREVWQRNPDLRLAQIVVNAVPRTGWACPEVFSCEDEIIEKGLHAVLELTGGNNDYNPPEQATLRAE